MKKLLLLIPLLTLLIACDDSEIYLGYQEPITDPIVINCDDLPAYVDQTAQGSFGDTNYTYQAAQFNTESNINTFMIFSHSISGGTCLLPEFEEDSHLTITFTLNSLEPQTINFEDLTTPLTFNITNNGTPSVQLASCGTFELVEHNTENNQVIGKITAQTLEGSTINGNVTFSLCEIE